MGSLSVEVRTEVLCGRICDLEAENAKLRELVRDYDKCLDTALWLAGEAGYPVMPDQKLFNSLRSRKRELGIEVDG